MMGWYAIGGSYSQSVKGNPGIFEEPFQIKNITEFVKKNDRNFKFETHTRMLQQLRVEFFQNPGLPDSLVLKWPYFGVASHFELRPCSCPFAYIFSV